MSASHLTDDEIASITDPLTQGAARIKFFQRLGCKVSPKPNGQPLVGRAEYEATITSKGNRQTASGPRPSNVVTPDWELLRALGGRKSKAA